MQIDVERRRAAEPNDAFSKVNHALRVQMNQRGVRETKLPEIDVRDARFALRLFEGLAGRVGELNGRGNVADRARRVRRTTKILSKSQRLVARPLLSDAHAFAVPFR